MSSGKYENLETLLAHVKNMRGQGVLYGNAFIGLLKDLAPYLRKEINVIIDLDNYGILQKIVELKDADESDKRREILNFNNTLTKDKCWRPDDAVNYINLLIEFYDWNVENLPFFQEDTANPTPHSKRTTGKAPSLDNGLLDVGALVKKGADALQYKKWKSALSFFEEALHEDSACAEAYLGQLLAKNEKNNFNAFFGTRFSDIRNKEQYSAIRMEAVYMNSGRINYIVNKYKDKNEKSRIRTELESKNRYYISYSFHWKRAQATEEAYVAELIKRLRTDYHYMTDGNKDVICLKLSDEICKQYLNRIKDKVKQSKDDDERNKKRVIEEYSKSLDDAENSIPESIPWYGNEVLYWTVILLVTAIIAIYSLVKMWPMLESNLDILRSDFRDLIFSGLCIMTTIPSAFVGSIWYGIAGTWKKCNYFSIRDYVVGVGCAVLGVLVAVVASHIIAAIIVWYFEHLFMGTILVLIIVIIGGLLSGEF